MKSSNNNIFKYIFIVVVVALIIGAIYILYYKNKDEDISEEENTIVSEESPISIVDNLKIGITNYDSMNPLLTRNKDIINIDRIVFEPLVEIKSDGQAELCLAKEINRVDNLNYIVKVDSNIKWQDGSDFSANDIEFTINKLKQINSVYSGNVQFIDHTKVLDKESIQITLSQPVNFIEYNLDFPIVSSNYYQGEDFQTSNKIPIGTGMYKIASIDNDNILLIRNDRWRKIKDCTPKTQSITLQRFNAIGEIFNAFKLGNIDIINTYMANYTDYIGTMGYNKVEYPGRDFEFISLNCADSILSDPAVRRAISYGINRENLVSAVFSHQKMVSYSPLDYGNKFNSGENVASYNKDMALTTLQSNGWVYTSGRWQKNINGYVRKLILSLVVSNDNIDRVNAALNIKNQLGEIGIEVNVVRVAPEKYAEYLNNKNYQMIITGVTNSINPELSYFYGNGNIANYDNENVKSKLGNLDEYKEMIKTANLDVPYIGLYRNKGILILNANVGGEFTSNAFATYYNFYKWFRQQ